MKDLMTVCADAFNAALRALPLRDRIVFESNPEFADNTYNVYRYLIEKKHIDEKYQIVWLVEDREHAAPPVQMKNTVFLNYQQNGRTIPERLKYHYYLNTSRALVYCNRLLGKKRKKQFSVCLQHGMPLKASGGGYCIRDNCDKCLCVSPFFADNYHKDFDISYEKMFFCPFPRTDDLFVARDVRSALGLEKYDKVFIWMPTYRKSSAEKMIGYNIDGTATGIPCVGTERELLELDAFLRERNSVILFKAHPVQPINVEIAAKLTNFMMIDHDYLTQRGVRLYELLGKTDALITDYSSVYYDYLLTDRPVALTLDDFEEYTGKRGFVYEDPLEVLKGAYIKNSQELISFFEDTLRGEDAFAVDRDQVKKRIYSDTEAVGNATAYVGELIWRELQSE